MSARLILSTGLGLLAITAVAALAQEAAPAPAEVLSALGAPPAPGQVQAGQEIYAANCASCHGAKLEGQPDWRRRLDTGRMPAPPHDESGHSWHHPDTDLFTITKLGVGAVVPGYESDMPAFAETLSDADIVAVLTYIKSTWPERQRTFQAGVSAKMQEGK